MALVRLHDDQMVDKDLIIVLKKKEICDGSWNIELVLKQTDPLVWNVKDEPAANELLKLINPKVAAGWKISPDALEKC